VFFNNKKLTVNNIGERGRERGREREREGERNREKKREI
jgi:hypothetical protein